MSHMRGVIEKTNPAHSTCAPARGIHGKNKPKLRLPRIPTSEEKKIGRSPAGSHRRTSSDVTVTATATVTSPTSGSKSTVAPPSDPNSLHPAKQPVHALNRPNVGASTHLPKQVCAPASPASADVVSGPSPVAW